jgi:hypothetical protein
MNELGRPLAGEAEAIARLPDGQRRTIRRVAA